jgi:methylated-DNA-protein-cysteine methyltransferase-like protein
MSKKAAIKMKSGSNFRVKEQTAKKEDKSSMLKMAVLRVVSTIPEGKVMYYGQIADMTGTTPRIVGFIMNGLTKEEMSLVPWYRVVAKDGFISSIKLGAKGDQQKRILKKEKYKLLEDKVDMNEHLWLFAGINRLEDKVEDYAAFIEGLKR